MTTAATRRDVTNILRVMVPIGALAADTARAILNRSDGSGCPRSECGAFETAGFIDALRILRHSPTIRVSTFYSPGGSMRVVRSRNFHLGLLLATGLSLSVLPTASEAYTDEQQQACSPDAMRLCGPEIPDVDRITACMARNKQQLSPQCRVFFETDSKARKARKPAKPHST
jgi:hypothetical protein